ncbi:GDSL-type esterase/lipase family protein [Pontibacter sp. G13]|uniref:GDSL-type esterase/lipase family protein n=1 Tax=Pontibacter sp. G13 TaxID=3074898 RepID=UPI00288AFDB5|nr:GDSL-type esterase/lipase family protein [Pontibacter sp. G13]WNJ20447.1 GDSL-type esterase/lipase family protein [Pontibacter sp. G13]
MNKMIIFGWCLLMSTNLFAQNRTFLFDLGPNDVTNGNITTGADANGHYWTNLIGGSAGTPNSDALTIDNQSTDIQIKNLSGFLSNGIQNGGLLAPEDSLLGDLAIATATQDYFFTTSSGTIALDGLNPGKGYVFTLFGTRNTTLTRVTEYAFSGANAYVDSLQTSGTDLGGAGYNGNNSTVVITPPIRPNANGRIVLNLDVVEGGFAYLGAIKMEEVDDHPTMLVDFGPNDVTNGNITVSPDGYGQYWNNVVETAAAASPVSLLTKDEDSTGAYIQITTGFQKNGIQNGGLLAPEDSLLGSLAVATATQDYFFTTNSSALEMGGLDTTSRYVFEFFGTRNSGSDRITSYILTGENTSTDSLQTSGTDLGGIGYNGNVGTVAISDTLSPNAQGMITLDVSVITGGFAYLGLMRITEIEALPEPEPPCPVQDSLLVAVMGSSVADGYGATNSEGYAFQYGQLLDARAGTGEGLAWSMANISIGGNNTVDVMNRWETDLIPLCGSYVIYGLSLGNEGISSNGQTAFNRFRDNMETLIDQSRQNGIEPIVVNCYARADFDNTEYQFTKDMNMLIHEWDVASINVLGAIDNGLGQWSTGYEADPYHPNTAGHTEFFYAMVPSLMDALHAGKPQPHKVDSTYLTIDQSVTDYQLSFTPDGILHPFTVSFDIRTSGHGPIGGFTKDDQGFGGLLINESTGSLDYVNDLGVAVAGTDVVNDGQWHRITISHYYAWGKTIVYVDEEMQGSFDENLEVDEFFLSEENSPVADFKEWMIFRSGMNEQEVAALVQGTMLKSSLTLYAPLDGQGLRGTDPYRNDAQSMNQIEEVDAAQIITALEEIPGKGYFEIYPNPVVDEAKIRFSLSSSAQLRISVCDMTGKVVETLAEGIYAQGTHEWNWTGNPTLPNQLYVCLVEVEGQVYTQKIQLSR